MRVWWLVDGYGRRLDLATHDDVVTLSTPDIFRLDQESAMALVDELLAIYGGARTSS